MKLLHVTTLYPGYIADFERRHPQVGPLGYAEHRALLYRDAFGWSDHFVRHLRERGHEAEHVVANYTALQAKWARENGASGGGGADEFAIVQAQARAARPDVLFVEDCYAFPVAKVRALEANVPSLRAVACHHGIESDVAELVPRDALLISCVTNLVEDWRGQGFTTALVRHAFEPAVLPLLPAGDAAAVTFVGSCSPLQHPERHEWLVALAGRVPQLEVWTDSFDVPVPRLARLAVASLARGRAARLVAHLTSPLRRHSRPGIYGLPMFAKLRDSKVTLNRHISLSRPAAGNMRLFEATGVGACLVTDTRYDLADIFAPDTEVVTFASNEECIEKVRWLLDHPAEAHAIARRGQQRTLRDHTFAQRAAELEALLLEQLRRRSRPAA